MSRINSYKQVGFKNVHYLPLGANTNRRKPVQSLSDADLEKYNSDISFVGYSMEDESKEFKDLFITSFEHDQLENNSKSTSTSKSKSNHINNNKDSNNIKPPDTSINNNKELHSTIRKILKKQRRNYSTYLIPELMRSEPMLNSFLQRISLKKPDIDFVMLIGQVAAAEQRAYYLQQLVSNNLDIVLIF